MADILSPEGQHDIAAHNIWRNLRALYPGLDETTALETFYATIRKPPPWSPTQSWQLVAGGTVAQVGASVICTFLEGERQIPMVILGKRQKIEQKGVVQYYGSGGGFGVLLRPDNSSEQPREMAVRELGEEICTTAGPLLKPDPMRLELIHSGVDDRGLAAGKLPVSYSCFHLALDADETATIRAHDARLRADPDYRLACFKASMEETVDIEIITLEDAAALKRDAFAHPHEADAIAMIARRFGLKTPKL